MTSDAVAAGHCWNMMTCSHAHRCCILCGDYCPSVTPNSSKKMKLVNLCSLQNFLTQQCRVRQNMSVEAVDPCTACIRNIAATAISIQIRGMKGRPLRDTQATDQSLSVVDKATQPHASACISCLSWLQRLKLRKHGKAADGGRRCCRLLPLQMFYALIKTHGTANHKHMDARLLHRIAVSLTRPPLPSSENLKSYFNYYLYALFDAREQAIVRAMAQACICDYRRVVLQHSLGFLPLFFANAKTVEAVREGLLDVHEDAKTHLHFLELSTARSSGSG